VADARFTTVNVVRWGNTWYVLLDAPRFADRNYAQQHAVARFEFGGAPASSNPDCLRALRAAKAKCQEVVRG
jgi:hypothetical protein